MSAKVFTIPNRMTECVGGCGSLVVGVFVCPQCLAFDEERRRKAKARLLAAMTREQTGVTFFPAPEPTPLSNRLAWPKPLLPALLTLSVLGASGLLWGGWLLGNAIIAWLCAVSA